MTREGGREGGAMGFEGAREGCGRREGGGAGWE